MRRVLVLLALASPAAADRSGPPPEPIRASKEVPCDRTAPAGGTLVGRYMCQLAIDGVWAQAVPCEIAGKPHASAGYLRMATWLSCDINGSVDHRAFDGAAWCIPAEADQIGHEALVEATLRAVPGGFRIDTVADMVKTFAFGPEDAIPRATRLVHTKTKLALNVCRRPWPADFKLDIPAPSAKHPD